VTIIQRYVNRVAIIRERETGVTIMEEHISMGENEMNEMITVLISDTRIYERG
jgi:hypothetical protein